MIEEKLLVLIFSLGVLQKHFNNFKSSSAILRMLSPELDV